MKDGEDITIALATFIIENYQPCSQEVAYDFATSVVISVLSIARRDIPDVISRQISLKQDTLNRIEALEESLMKSSEIARELTATAKVTNIRSPFSVPRSHDSYFEDTHNTIEERLLEVRSSRHKMVSRIYDDIRRTEVFASSRVRKEVANTCGSYFFAVSGLHPMIYSRPEDRKKFGPFLDFVKQVFRILNLNDCCERSALQASRRLKRAHPGPKTIGTRNTRHYDVKLMDNPYV